MIVLASPELVHAGKGRRMLGLEDMPSLEVAHGVFLGEPLLKFSAHAGVDLEAEELDTVLGQEAANLGQRHLLLLHMKEHVAAFADGEKIEVRPDAFRPIPV